MTEHIWKGFGVRDKRPGKCGKQIMRDNVNYLYKKIFISIWIGGIAGICLSDFVKQSDFVKEKLGGSSLIQYAVLCFSFMLASLIANVFLQLSFFNKGRLIDSVCCISCAGIVAFMYICWERDVDVTNSNASTYLWHMYPTVLVFIILGILILLYKTVIENIDFDNVNMKYGTVLYYSLVVFLSGYSNYFLEYLSADYYHGSAVFNSVYNVYHGMPYEETINCIYGNYALFLALPMKIMGNGEYFDFSRIMSLLTMLCTALGIYVIHNLVNKELRVLCVTALLWVDIFRGKNYWQLDPLRVFCPVLLLAWLVFITKKIDRSKSYYKPVSIVGTYLLLVFSIVWNKESGIVCLIGYIAFLALNGFAEFLSSKSFRHLWKTCLEILIMVTTLFSAICVVGIYNFIVARKWITWEIFMFPLLTHKYMGGLAIGLPEGIWPWMAVAFLFLGVIMALALKLLRKEEAEPDEYIYATAAILGLGLMTYFVNRAVYGNLKICYYEAIICIGGVCSYVNRQDYGRIIAGCIKTLQTAVLIALVAGELLRLGNSLQPKASSSRQEILELRNEIREDAEVDTYAFGINIPELYSILGWKTRSFSTDWADIGIMREANMQKLYAGLESEDSIITDKKTFERNKEVAEYVQDLFYIDKVYTYNENVEFYLMKRKK